MRTVIVCVLPLLLLTFMCQIGAQGATLPVPDLTLDSGVNVYGSGFLTELSPVTFDVLNAYTPTDELSIRAVGQTDLATNLSNYEVNAAGIRLLDGQPWYTLGSGSRRYGELLIGNVSLGYHSVFPADASVGVGSTPVPTDISVARSLGDIFGPSFTGVSAGTTLGFLVYDSDHRDNGGGLQLSSAPVPEPTSLAMWAGLGVMGLFGVRRRRK